MKVIFALSKFRGENNRLQWRSLLLGMLQNVLICSVSTAGGGGPRIAPRAGWHQWTGERGERWMTNVAFFAESGRNSDIWPV